jgi:hypothetical protein
MGHALEDEHYYDIDSEKCWRMRQEDDELLCNGQALMLLEHLDPYVWAIQATKTGIVLYPRAQVHTLTTWEQTLLRTELPIPAEWIGGLDHIAQTTQMHSRKSLATSGMSPINWAIKGASGRAQAVAFSLTRFNQMMREFSSAGLTTQTGLTPDVCQSTSKERSGRRRWKRNAKPSSKTQ